MNTAVLKWAFRQRKLSPPQKLILLCLAAHYKTDQGISSPKTSRVCVDTGLSESSVRRHLAALIEDDVIVLEKKERHNDAHIYILGYDSDKDGGNDSKEFIREAFNAFWEEYPRKENKQAALKAFMRLRPNEKLAMRLIKDVRRRVATEWADSVKYVPHGSTYINNRRWEDEPPPVERFDKGGADEILKAL